MGNQQQMIDLVLSLGADGAGTVAVNQIVFEPSFRKLCESNACGMFNRSWMCPPQIGGIDELISQARNFSWALVYQIINKLEDSYDFEGMMAAAHRINHLSIKLRERLDEMGYPARLHLGAGGCQVCQRCAKLDDLPCRKPEWAMSSLEAYGINVSALAKQAGMRYTNGSGTVTYFGVVLLRERDKP